MESNVIWQNILAKLSERIPEAKVKCLLSPLCCDVRTDGQIAGKNDAEHFAGCSITLATGNAFILSKAKELEAQIAECSSQVLGCPTTINFVCDKGHASDACLLRPALADFSQSLPSTAPTLIMSSEKLSLPVPLPRVRASANGARASWKYSFEDFVVGPCNKVAHAAASNIIEEHSPVDMVLLCAGAGLGKTHLTQAVGRALSLVADVKHVKMEYLTAEEFFSQFAHAVKFNAIDEFKDRFRNLDMLLLEDIHCLRGKDKTQEELLYTIKSLQNRGGRVVLTSSFAPSDLVGVDSQLVSQFRSAFVATMDRPDRDTRLEILREKARRQCMNLPGPVANLLADRVSGDVRTLESCLKNLMLQAQFSGSAISEQMAMDVIRNVARDNPELDLDDVIDLVCKSFSITPKQLESKSRRQNIVVARNTAFFLLRKHTDLTLAQIGERFNRRHSTVIKGITSLESEMNRHTRLGNQIEHTVKLIERSTSCR